MNAGLRALEAKARFASARYAALAALAEPGDDPTGALADVILAADAVVVERLAVFAEEEADHWWLEDFLRRGAAGDDEEAR